MRFTFSANAFLVKFLKILWDRLACILWLLPSTGRSCRFVCSMKSEYDPRDTMPRGAIEFSLAVTDGRQGKDGSRRLRLRKRTL